MWQVRVEGSNQQKAPFLKCQQHCNVWRWKITFIMHYAVLVAALVK